jgi:2-oxo-4-hydroxy-4-carboxy-5-ureidoimidazoline decarboxylase
MAEAAEGTDAIAGTETATDGADVRMRVADFDLAPAAAATAALAPCCASRRWLDLMVSDRPYVVLPALMSAGESALSGLDWADILEALAAHPRIGQRAAGPDLESSWSRGEQSGAATADRPTADALLRGNADYDERFGFVFLICATGLSADQILTQLTRRLANDPDVEQAEVRTELAKIVAIRLEKAFVS